MRRLFLSLFVAIAAVPTLQAQQLLIVNDNVAIDIHDIDHISYAADPETTCLLMCEMLAVDPKTTLFSQALQLTGLADSLLVYEDENYPTNLSRKSFTVLDKAEGYSWGYYQASRPRRFTVFVETDSVFRAAGINNIDDLKAWAKRTYDEVFPQDASVSNPTDRRHSLNRFVSYHILPHAAGYGSLTPVNDRNTTMLSNWPGTTRDVTTYYETLMPYASMKCSYPQRVNPDGIYLNRRGLRNDCTVRGIHIMKSENGIDHWTDNGCYYYIDNLLAYDKTTQEQVLYDMWRVDFKTLSPDLLNIGFRYGDETYIGLPSAFVDNFDTDAELVAMSPHQPFWRSYDGDGVFCPNMRRLTVKLPPLPQATWQVRLGYNVSADRPVINTYINGVPQFTNIDLRAYKSFEDIDADPNLFRGPDDYFTNDYEPMSSFVNSIRVVVGNFYANGEQDNYLTIEVVSNDESSYFPLDYLEFVPVIQ